MRETLGWRERSGASWRQGLAALTLILATTAGASTAFAASVTETQPETAGSPSEKQFCERRLGGDFFIKTELYFGLSKPGGVVGDDDFNEFIDTAVTPRFPDGLTLLRGRGQFRDASGTIVEEGSRLLILLYPFSKTASNRVDRIREEYITAFQQQSVLRVDEMSCVSF